MLETSEIYTPSILLGTPKYTCSSASLDGATLCDSQAGPIVDLCGPDRAPASLSARRAKEQGLMTSGTYGPHSSTSLNSDILQLSLESRLQARLDSRGSTLFKLTWKHRATPQQRSIYALRASGLRTSVSVYSGVPTPCSQDGPKGGPGQGTDRLPGAAALAAVPTPMAGTPAQNGNNEAGNNDFSRKIVALASTATPSARDYKSNSSTEEFQSKQWNHPRGKPLSAQATLADSGEAVTGGTAVTKSSGQLNPNYSRWLQGYPNEWGNCADMVILSSRKSRKSS